MLMLFSVGKYIKCLEYCFMNSKRWALSHKVERVVSLLGSILGSIYYLLSSRTNHFWELTHHPPRLPSKINLEHSDCVAKKKESGSTAYIHPDYADRYRTLS
jgi:hypothetical protein